MKRLIFLAVALFILLPNSPVQVQEQADREAVRLAVLDYVEGIYGVDPSRVERSVHPKLAKIGFYRGPNEQAFRAGSNMTFEQLIGIAKKLEQRRQAPKGCAERGHHL
jgi:hypothetical protein